MRHWHALQVREGQEESVHAVLIQQGVDEEHVFLPLYEMEPGKGVEPIFPGIIFMHPEALRKVRQILDWHAVEGIVADGSGKPAPIPGK